VTLYHTQSCWFDVSNGQLRSRHGRTSPLHCLCRRQWPRLQDRHNGTTSAYNRLIAANAASRCTFCSSGGSRLLYRPRLPGFFTSFRHSNSFFLPVKRDRRIQFLSRCILAIARSVSDEAIQGGASDWIASLHFVALAMTSRSRDAPSSAGRRNVFGAASRQRMLPVVDASDAAAGLSASPLASRRSTAVLVAATERFDSAQAALHASGRAQALPTSPIALKRSTSRAGRTAGGDRPGAG
jgi:hypothetical protein